MDEKELQITASKGHVGKMLQKPVFRPAANNQLAFRVVTQLVDTLPEGAERSLWRRNSKHARFLALASPSSKAYSVAARLWCKLFSQTPRWTGNSCSYYGLENATFQAISKTLNDLVPDLKAVRLFSAVLRNRRNSVLKEKPQSIPNMQCPVFSTARFLDAVTAPMSADLYWVLKRPKGYIDDPNWRPRNRYSSHLSIYPFALRQYPLDIRKHTLWPVLRMFWTDNHVTSRQNTAFPNGVYTDECWNIVILCLMVHSHAGQMRGSLLVPHEFITTTHTHNDILIVMRDEPKSRTKGAFHVQSAHQSEVYLDDMKYATNDAWAQFERGRGNKSLDIFAELNDSGSFVMLLQAGNMSLESASIPQAFRSPCHQRLRWDGYDRWSISLGLQYRTGRSHPTVGVGVDHQPHDHACAVGDPYPYDAQYRRLQVVVRALEQDNPTLNLSQIRVRKVDGFQGREGDVVILSIPNTTSPGFVRKATRLNVVLTRAKRAMYIFLNAQQIRDWNKKKSAPTPQTAIPAPAAPPTVVAEPGTNIPSAGSASSQPSGDPTTSAEPAPVWKYEVYHIPNTMSSREALSHTRSFN
ncbi:hypothetical protein BGW36DRAFT_358864 [Talaromyces proteolyticus]|uniref:DNA2/NAM7 helicase-like C-terminal domain-containing protein n=1 Tax=Talaromyces proteolyticus TaxID=1131652 RepID=A0AAD4PXU8_9EURO|nr:uncharacterized protein BGW36DRAFT_358864 [Talaromyces proteolyticus]KAH8697049.1 hypothetical protein BGW36DRAFT_358864 [Talaromyces proteolyticus]